MKLSHSRSIATKRLVKAGLLIAPACILGGVACARTPQTVAQNSVQPVRALGNKPAPAHTLTGQDALGDWTTDAPGVRRKITLADLPAQYATPSIDNGPRMVRRPEGATPKVPAGFQVEEYVTGLDNPRYIQTAPNGDVFVVESGPERVKILRPSPTGGKPQVFEYVSGLSKPFGVAFYPAGPNPQYVYVANTDSIVRFPYQNGDTQARGQAETIINDIPGGGRLRGGGHWTRDIRFSPDGKRLFVSVGSISNVHERANLPDERRADILEYTIDGKNERIFASGIRNPVGLAIHPVTGQLWCSVNERDALGDHLVPDYITHVEDGGFYGWPWYYMGGHEDTRAQGDHPDLKNKVITPDVLLQSHSASLAMTFYTGKQFPKEYALDAFASEHGSWNRARRTGYKVIRVPMKNGKATGEYEDFLTGFVTPEGDVWGRPVGVTVAKDGALLVTDDGSGTVWRISYTGKGASQNTASVR